MESVDIPPQWRLLERKMAKGVVLVIGGVDTGKSTLVRYLAGRLRLDRKVVWIDGDIGQTTTGPPTTQTLNIPEAGASYRPLARWFVGATSPSGHMLQTITGLQRLVQKAIGWGAETILVDTTGFIAPNAGGLTLKWSKFELLAPSIVVALQRENELEPILSPWRKCARFSIADVPVASMVKKSSASKRRAFRHSHFKHYFQQSRRVSLSVDNVGIVGRSPLQKRQLVGMIDRMGFLAALGIVEEMDRKEIVLRMPLTSTGEIDMLRAGSLMLDEDLNEIAIAR